MLKKLCDSGQAGSRRQLSALAEAHPAVTQEEITGKIRAPHIQAKITALGLWRTHRSGLSSSVAGRGQDRVGQMFGCDARRLDRQITIRCGEAFDQCGAGRERRHPAAAVAGVPLGTRAALGAEQTKRSLAPLRESSSSFICNRWSATWFLSLCARRATRCPRRRLPLCRRPDQPRIATIRRGRNGQGS